MTKDVLDYLAEITAVGPDEYLMTDGAREFFTKYLARYGFDLAKLNTKTELLEAIGVCNSNDFCSLIQQSSPTESLRFLWHRLRAMFS